MSAKGSRIRQCSREKGHTTSYSGSRASLSRLSVSFSLHVCPSIFIKRKENPPLSFYRKPWSGGGGNKYEKPSIDNRKKLCRRVGRRMFPRGFPSRGMCISLAYDRSNLSYTLSKHYRGLCVMLFVTEKMKIKMRSDHHRLWKKLTRWKLCSHSARPRQISPTRS